MLCSEPRSSLLAPRYCAGYRTWVLAFATLAAWLPVAGASELQWQRGRKTFEKPRTQSTAQNSVRQQKANHRSDRSVRPAVFEDDAPRLTSGREGEAHIRSVIVNRNDEPETFRSAQLPSGAGTSGATDAPNTNSQLETPFGDMPELETPEMGELDPGDMPEPPVDNTLQPGETGRQPMQRQPAVGPSTGSPSRDFQPNRGAAPQTQPADNVPSSNTAAVQAENQRTQESCDESLQNLRAKTINTLTLDIAVAGDEGADFPFECSVDNGEMHSGRCWEQTTYMWKASALCHKPLYFEDEQLERYGHSFSPCFQPFVSGAHFFCTLPVLPYCMGVEPPCECVYALGHYRPGNCAPYMCNPIPISCRGALFEAGAVTGAAAVLP